MHEVVLSNLHNRLASSARIPSFAGQGLPERMRSTAFAFLGLTAAAGLALVALFAQPSFSLLSPAPMPNDPSRANAVADATAVAAHPALGESIPAPRAGVAEGARRGEAGSGPADSGSDRKGAVADGSPQPNAAGGIGSPTGAGNAPAPPQASPAPISAPAPTPAPQPVAAPAPAPAPEAASASQSRGDTAAPSAPSTTSPSPGRSTAAVTPTRSNSGRSSGSKGPPAHAASVRKSGTKPAPAPAPPPASVPAPAPAAAPAAAGGPPAHSAAGGNGNGKALGHSK